MYKIVVKCSVLGKNCKKFEEITGNSFNHCLIKARNLGWKIEDKFICKFCQEGKNEKELCNNKV